MSPQNTQTVYTVLDCLAALPIIWLLYFAAGSMFSGVARVTSVRWSSLVFILSVAWLALRGFGVIA